MAQPTRKRSGKDRDAEDAEEELPPMSAREAADIAREYITELAGQESFAMTSVEPADDDGWVVELEVVEERRIPSTSDIIGVYEVQLDGDGELLAFKRTRRYMRGQTDHSSSGGGM